MRKHSTFFGLVIMAFVLLAFQSCQKQNGIDNNNVIKTPYALYFTDSLGALRVTNTGDSAGFRIVFPIDGYSARSLVTSGDNIVWVKKNTHVSTDDGHHFNPTDSSVLKDAYWQSMMLDVPSLNRLYLCNTGLAHGAMSEGLIYSEDHGKTWLVDTIWNDTLNTTRMSSLAQLSDGSLYVHNNANNKLYVRDGDGRWQIVNYQSRPDDGGLYYLSSYNNILVLTDYNGTKGVWHSEDNGKNWSQYSGLPANTQLLCTNAPFGQVLLVGTKGAGVYALKNNTFVAVNNGMAKFNAVYGIAGKSNIYKNGAEKKYIYVTSEEGLYRSEDMGDNWIQVIEGRFRTIY